MNKRAAARLNGPPLFLARTCSIVLSLCLGIELEKDRICSCTPFIRLPAYKFVFDKHDALFVVAIRSDVAGFELWADAKVRRAVDWMGRRSAGAALRVLDAPAIQLHAEDMSIVVSGGYEMWRMRGGRVESCWMTFDMYDRAPKSQSSPCAVVSANHTSSTLFCRMRVATKWILPFSRNLLYCFAMFVVYNLCSDPCVVSLDAPLGMQRCSSATQHVK
jgi:hypothetical protein